MSTRTAVEDEAVPTRPRRGIQSVEVGGKILQALAAAARPTQLKDLVKAAGMAPGKIHPYLVSFGNIGLVSQEPMTGLYQLGPLAIQLGLTSLHTLKPVREAAPFAEALAQETGHSVAIAVWGIAGPVIVRIIDARETVQTNLRTGTVMALVGTATGRVFAAFLPRASIENLLTEDRIRLGHDIAQPLSLKAAEDMIEDVRMRKLARNIDAPAPGVTAFSAPVFERGGGLALAITIIGPTENMDSAWNGSVAKALRRCTHEVSRRLGYLPA